MKIANIQYLTEEKVYLIFHFGLTHDASLRYFSSWYGSFQDAAGCEEEKILCIIRDMVDTKNCVKHTMNLPASTSVRMMINDVAKKFNYVIGTISVHYERQADRGQIEEVS